MRAIAVHRVLVGLIVPLATALAALAACGQSDEGGTPEADVTDAAAPAPIPGDGGSRLDGSPADDGAVPPSACATPLAKGATATRVFGAKGIYYDGPQWSDGRLYLLSRFDGRVLVLEAADATQVGVVASAQRIMSGTPSPTFASRLVRLPSGTLVATTRMVAGVAATISGTIAQPVFGDGGANPPFTALTGGRFPIGITWTSGDYGYLASADFSAVNGTENGIYRVAFPGYAVTPIEKFDVQFEKPDGVALSPDQKTLYASIHDTGVIRRYPLDATGLSAGGADLAVLAPGSGPRDLAVDTGGNVYVAVSTGVLVLSPGGAELGRVTIPASVDARSTGLAFGGADAKTLHVTTGGTDGEAEGAVYTIAVACPGIP